jgi:hypothetical protein
MCRWIAFGKSRNSFFDGFEFLFGFDDGLAKLIELDVGHRSLVLGDMQEVFVDGIRIGFLDGSDRACDLAQVSQEDVAAVALRRDSFSFSDEGCQRSPDGLDTESKFLFDIGRIGDSFFGFAGEWNPDAGYVNDERDGPVGERALGLGQPVGTPIRVDDRLGDCARALRVLKRNAVGKAVDLHRLPFRDIDFTQDGMERIDLLLFEFLRAAAGG